MAQLIAPQEAINEAINEEPLWETSLAERRRFNRVNIQLLGRFMREDRSEHPCQTINMSPGGVALLSYEIVFVNEKLILYLDQIGRLEGKVTRHFNDGFGVAIRTSPAKRKKIAEKLTWLINRDELGLLDSRRYDRQVPTNPLSEIEYEDGSRLQVKVLDVSIGGASVAMRQRPAIGTRVVLGGIRGKVVRYHDKGIGIEFTELQTQTSLSGYFRRPGK